MEASSLPVTPSPIELLKQSKLGIASFVLGICAVLGLIGFFAAVYYSALMWGEDAIFIDFSFLTDVSGVASFFWMLCGWFISPMIGLVGLGLGIPAVIQKKAKKTFGIIGLVLNGVSLLPLCFILSIVIREAVGRVI